MSVLTRLQSGRPSRIAPPRFHKARAALALLLSAAVFAFGALKQLRTLPGELVQPHASIWDDRSEEAQTGAQGQR